MLRRLAKINPQITRSETGSRSVNNRHHRQLNRNTHQGLCMLHRHTHVYSVHNSL